MSYKVASVTCSCCTCTASLSPVSCTRISSCDGSPPLPALCACSVLLIVAPSMTPAPALARSLSSAISPEPPRTREILETGDQGKGADRRSLEIKQALRLRMEVGVYFSGSPIRNNCLCIAPRPGPISIASPFQVQRRNDSSMPPARTEGRLQNTGVGEHRSELPRCP